jgi:citrate synthase
MSAIKLVAKPGEVDFPKGMEGIIARESTKSFVDGAKGYLCYHGIPIQQLAENSTFEEVCYLLLYDALPNEQQLADFNQRLKQYRDIPDFTYEVIMDMPTYNVHPMATLRTAVSTLSLADESAEEDTPEALERAGIRLIAKMGTVVAAIGRARKGLEPVRPRFDLDYGANFMYMYLGEDPDPLYAKVMDIILLLHADHGCNASTFTSIVATSSMSDMYSSVVAGICSLKGPLHGGANERVMRMLAEIGEVENAETYILNAIAKKKKIMGFGHRVYKAYDPRAAILQEYAKDVTAKAGTTKWLEMARIIERVMIDKLGKKGIYPNVDFYSGTVMASMGIEPSLFTPIFTVGRTPGWVSHILEQRADNRIFRPRFVYTGPMDVDYVPLEER